MESNVGGRIGCCVCGCGPAGAVLGYLLARAGIRVVVLEKHGDFLRDFRGDTIHPSVLEILDELGLADELLALPHNKVSNVGGRTAAGQAIGFTLERLRTKFPYIAFVPQWDFLEFITNRAARFPSFTLIRNADVLDLIERGGVVTGVRYRDAAGEHELTALLTVGADGRSSRSRQAAGLPLRETSPPMDVLWFRLPRHAGEPRAIAGRLGPGRVLVMLDRGDYWQIAFAIAKGTADSIRGAGLARFREEVVSVAPELSDRVSSITDWEQVKLLTVRADRLARWHKPGYLAIGDAAHAMSPIGGLGINVAIQDAVAAANVLWRPLSQGRVRDDDLAEVQRKRERAVRVLQGFQSVVQTRFLGPALASSSTPTIPLIVRILSRVPLLRDIPPRLIAFGIDRPHVESPERPPAQVTPPTADRDQ
jgi:2-polyprenyl-6-methoxyphenol hydroxylase-like FAD-dependent oxidoreductase